MSWVITFLNDKSMGYVPLSQLSEQDFKDKAPFANKSIRMMGNQDLIYKEKIINKADTHVRLPETHLLSARRVAVFFFSAQLPGVLPRNIPGSSQKSFCVWVNQ